MHFLLELDIYSRKAYLEFYGENTHGTYGSPKNCNEINNNIMKFLFTVRN